MTSTNTNKNWEKFFLGFGIVTILSGIYLITQGDYISGLCGASTGMLLVYWNRLQNGKEKEA